MTMNKLYSFNQAFQLLKDKGIIHGDSSFIKIDEGIVHEVYKIKSGNDVYFLKIRSDHFKANKKIKINPLDISHEKKAIDLISRYSRSGLAPKIYFFSGNILLLENIQDKDSESIYKMLYSQKLSNENARQVGIRMKEFHRVMSKTKEQIRSRQKELEMYDNYLYWRFGVWHNKNLDIIVDELRGYKRQYIYGDFNPKNIVLCGGQLRIFDLETFHRGNTLFDVGFFAGHVLLNFLNKPLKKIELIKNFFQGYNLNSGELQMAIKLTLATLYYRLKSGYSYGVNFKYNKNATLKKIDAILTQGNHYVALSDLKKL